MEIAGSNAFVQYGQACQACSHSKCRCIPRDSGHGCQRCHRLKKECRSAVRVRKPKALSKAAQLEQKLDGLMSKLQSKSDETMLQPGSIHSDHPRTNQSTHQSTSSIPVLLSRYEMPIVFSVADEEEFLKTFCRDKLYYLPFIYIPPGTSAQQLKHTSPFLWQCIAAAQTGHSIQRAQMVTKIKEIAARKLLVDCTKNLDLLQGLFVYAGWITYQTQPQARSSCIYTQMTISIVQELGLDKPPRDAGLNTVTEFPIAEALPHLPLPVSPSRTMNERRAAISCYILSSANSQFLSLVEPLRWNTHLGESLKVLSEMHETKHDLILVEICRIRLITDKIAQLTRRERESFDVPQAPLYFHMSALKLELDELQSKMPLDLLQDKRMIIHLSHAEMSLYAIAALKIYPQLDPGSTKRLDYLHACLMATKRYFDSFYEIIPTDYTAFSGLHLIEGVRCLYTLFQLTVLEYPGWDREAVRNTLDILQVAEYFGHSLQQAEEELRLRTPGSQPGNLDNLVLMINRLRVIWGAILRDQPPAPSLTTQDLSGWYLDSMFAWPGTSWMSDPGISEMGTLDEHEAHGGPIRHLHDDSG